MLVYLGTLERRATTGLSRYGEEDEDGADVNMHLKRLVDLAGNVVESFIYIEEDELVQDWYFEDLDADEVDEDTGDYRDYGTMTRSWTRTVR